MRAVAGLAIVRAGELGLFPRGVSSELRKRGGFFLTGALPDCDRLAAPSVYSSECECVCVYAATGTLRV